MNYTNQHMGMKGITSTNRNINYNRSGTMGMKGLTDVSANGHYKNPTQVSNGFYRVDQKDIIKDRVVRYNPIAKKNVSYNPITIRDRIREKIIRYNPVNKTSNNRNFTNIVPFRFK